MKLPEVINLKAVFELPNWVTDERYEYDKVFYYNQFHAWAGSYDRTESGFNVVTDMIFEMEGVKETCFYPGNAWIEVEFTCGITALPAEVLEFQRDLVIVLAKARVLTGETVYINKPEVSHATG